MEKVRRLFNIGKKYLVGGVNSPVRTFKYAGTQPLLIRNGSGSKVYDYKGKRYIDFVLSWGALILGHAHPQVLRDTQKKLAGGLSFGVTNETEVELAREIVRAVSFIDKVRFVNSGTEAVMGAVRLARGYTKKNKIIKFINSYHGHADYLLSKAGSGLATLGLSASAGVPKDFTKHTLVLSFGDKAALNEAFRKYPKEIAAVLVEPVRGNFGVLPPCLDFLKYLRKVTRQYRALLVFDEVITGFRFHYGTAAQKFGLTPDLICLGKIIGGGLPIGAYAGREKIMDNLAPLGPVYQASTFAGNPIVMQTGLTTLRLLRKQKSEYRRIRKLAEYLSLSLEREAIRRGISLKVSHYENMFSLKFRDQKLFQEFYKHTLKKGIFFAPSEFEANFLSFAHTRKDIDKTLEVAVEALDGLV